MDPRPPYQPAGVVTFGRWPCEDTFTLAQPREHHEVLCQGEGFMAFWWVNHKKTRDHEVRGGYLWSPMRNANGVRNKAYENMTAVRPGDTVFSYAHGKIGAIGRVTEGASVSPKPSEFGSVGDYWSNEGWLVEVYFAPVPNSLEPKAHLDLIGPLLPHRYSPLKADGNGNEFYLAAISDALGLILLSLLEIEETPDTIAGVRISDLREDATILGDLHSIEIDASIPETQRYQLAKARVGQGYFRNQVLLRDPSCRVTGVDDARLLIASHIKPWREATNSERINGDNGIMLSPHIDALFDAQLISFEDAGEMIIHPSLSNDILDKWCIPRRKKVKPFLGEQKIFLAHHRKLFSEKVA
jgi:hypothetical protein